MILNLLRKDKATGSVFAVYSAIVAQSRQPHFYAHWGVPDTVTGRFDMISLHLALVFMRLRREGGAAATFAQELFDLFFKDMDRSLREMGVGDLGVPKRVQKMSSVFYGLLASLSEALDAKDRPALETVLKRNIYADMPDHDAGPLAAYLLAQADRLAAMPASTITGGTVTFSEPSHDQAHSA